MSLVRYVTLTFKFGALRTLTLTWPTGLAQPRSCKLVDRGANEFGALRLRNPQHHPWAPPHSVELQSSRVPDIGAGLRFPSLGLPGSRSLPFLPAHNQNTTHRPAHAYACPDAHAEADRTYPSPVSACTQATVSPGKRPASQVSFSARRRLPQKGEHLLLDLSRDSRCGPALDRALEAS